MNKIIFLGDQNGQYKMNVGECCNPFITKIKFYKNKSVTYPLRVLQVLKKNSY